MTHDDDRPAALLSEENRALRDRVSELERKLSDLEARTPDSGTRSALRELAAERAAAGFSTTSGVMLLVADLVEGRFLEMNDTVSHVLGYSKQELLESSFLDRVHPEDHSRTMLEMERLVAGRQTTNFRNRHRAADGTWVTFEWMSVADSEGELCFAMAKVVED